MNKFVVEYQKFLNAKVICDSSFQNNRLITMELTMPKFLMAQFNKHRMITNSAASARAIPINKFIQYTQDNMVIPVFWGAKTKGMKAQMENKNAIYFNGQIISRFDMWRKTCDYLISIAQAYEKAGYHKEIINRLLETFFATKVVATGTLESWQHFLMLRTHKDAQSEIQLLANLIQDNIYESIPQELIEGDYHLPYITNELRQKYTIDQLIKISASCCAQVSYRTNDDSFEKAERIYDLLINSKPEHATPVEHIALIWDPSTKFNNTETLENMTLKEIKQLAPQGINTINIQSNTLFRHFRSNNFSGPFIQYRAILNI